MDELTYLLKGFRMLTHKSLRAYVLIPLLINIILFVLLVIWGVHGFEHFLQWIEAKLPSWLQWLSWLLWILFVLGAIVMVSYSFSLLANLIGAPFNGFLSAKVQEIVTGQRPDNGLKLWQEAPYALMRQLRFIGYYFLWAILALTLFFIPVVNLIATPVWFLLNAWMMSLQYLDYPMDNNRISFSQMRAKMAQQRGANVSFGSVVLLATLVPVLNFLIMPSAVIGATLFYIEKYKP